MKIDFSQKLFTLRGEPLEVAEKKDDKEKKTHMTLGYACSEALLATIVHLDRDRNEGGKSKWERWELAGKIIKAKEPIELEAEDIVKIKDRVGVMYGPPVVGPVFVLLKGKEEEEKPKTDE